MNLPTIIVAAVLAVIVGAIVVFEVRKRRQGKPACACGGDCGSCGGCGK